MALQPSGKSRHGTGIPWVVAIHSSLVEMSLIHRVDGLKIYFAL